LKIGCLGGLDAQIDLSAGCMKCGEDEAKSNSCNF